MFLIAKIVRGRRLLHQLEQEVEREKAAKAMAEQREKLLRAMPSEDQQQQQHQTAGNEGQKTLEAANEQADLSAAAAIELRDVGIGGLGGLGGGIGLDPATKALLEAERIRRRRQRAAIRQRTDSSLPSEDTDHQLAAGSSKEQQQQAMRRTSSMPSIVDEGEPSHHYNNQLLARHNQLSIFPRKGHRTVRHYNYEDKLSKLQKRALRFTWQRLLTRNGGKRIEAVFEEVFERMMRSLPIMREMFNTRTFISAMSRCEIASPRDHARLIVKMFEAAIKNLEVEKDKRTDTESDFDPKLLGQAHSSLRPYGFTSALWEAFGEAVIDIVLNQEAVRDLPGASQAWVVLTACMVDQLRAGFESVRECPFKLQHRTPQHKDSTQVNGTYAETENASPSNMTVDLVQPLHRLNTARRRTITVADQEGVRLLEQSGGQMLLAGGIGQKSRSEEVRSAALPALRERRCFSIMPTSVDGSASRPSSFPPPGNSGNSAAAETAQLRVQLKFLQDMASTEL